MGTFAPPQLSSAKNRAEGSSRAIQPIVPNREKNYGTRPSDFFYLIYLMVRDQWIIPRPTMAQVDGDVRHVLPLILGETHETLAETDRSEIDMIEYPKETGDILVLTNSATINNDITPNFRKIAEYTNGQAPSETIFLAKMEQLTQASLVDPEDPQQLKAQLESIFMVAGSFLNHGPALPSPEYILEAMRWVIKKNIRNYPEMYFKATHWLTGKALSESEAEASYHHAVKCLRLIRTATGNKLTGLDHQDHWPYRRLIHDFEHSEQALAQLRGALAGGVAQVDVRPNYWQNSPSKSVTVYSAEQLRQ